MRLLVSLLSLLSLAPSGPQSVTIDWTLDGIPHVHAADAAAAEADAEGAAAEPDADSFEDAWWRGGFAEDSATEWFAASREPRGARPASMVELNHRVGTTFTHTLTGAIGVIVGWDARTRAPRQWLGPNLPGDRSWAERLRRLYAPHYSVLEQLEMSGGELRFQQRYIVAHCTEAGESGPPCLRLDQPARKLRHPDIDRFFRAFDPSVGYLPNAELAARYPQG